jgi:predicted nucleotidyltransferase
MNKSELESELKKLASKIKEITPATKIYLFGSYAYGTPNEDSDIDLCILTDENKRKLEILREIRRNVGDINYQLDILVYKTDEFNERVNNKYIMESKIYKDGVEIL